MSHPGRVRTPEPQRRSLTQEARRAQRARFPHLDTEAATLGITLTRAAHAHANISEEVVHRQQARNWLVFRVLYVVWAFEPVSARDVVEVMQLSRQTVSNTLRALEADGLVARTRDAHDARLITIRLTEQGRASFEAALEHQFALDSRIFEVLTADERDQLSSLLNRVRAQILTLEQESSDVADESRPA